MIAVKNITFPKCCNCLIEDIRAKINDTGKLLVVNVKIEKVLCNRFVNVGVLVFQGPVLKGFEARKIYTGKCNCNCKYINIITRPFYFVFCDKENCEEEKFKVKVISNYVID